MSINSNMFLRRYEFYKNIYVQIKLFFQDSQSYYVQFMGANRDTQMFQKNLLSIIYSFWESTPSLFSEFLFPLPFHFKQCYNNR